MSIEQIVALLIAERDKLNRAIAALGAPGTHRGRPRKDAVIDAAGPVVPKKGRRRKRTAAEKKAQAERMRAYWAAKKKRKK